MKLKTVDGTRERNVLIGMIVHDGVVARIAPRWTKDGLFKSKEANLIASWCVKYHRKHGRAPRKDIETVFGTWADGADASEVKVVEKVLGSLDGQYKATAKAINPEFLVNTAGDLFNEVRLDKLRSAIAADMDFGKYEDAWKKVEQLRKVNVGAGEVIDVLQDDTANELVFTERPESLVDYGGGLKRFFGRSLARGNLVAFMAPMKRGKTFACMDIAWRAMLQRRRVVYFQCGDLTKSQQMTRFATRAAQRPFEAKRIQYPVKLEMIDDQVTVKKVEKSWTDDMGFLEQKKARERIMSHRIKSKDPFLKLSVHPTKTLSVLQSRAILDEMIHFNWIPDIVVYDYADILAPPPGFQGDSRDAVNETWMALRRLSQELNCLVVTATQAKATSFTADTLDMSHFSEDNRKLAHATGIVGLGQKNEEKPDQLWRWNWIVLREEAFVVTRECHVAGCLEIANPAIVSEMF